MKHLIIVSLLASTPLLSSVVYAGDASAGKAKSASCAACHGPEGISSNSEWPNLAGQQEKYLVNQLKEFRDGGRENVLMSPMSKSLSDEDIDDISAYYASLK